MLVYRNILRTYFKWMIPYARNIETQPAIICSKLTIETLEQGVKYVQS